MPQDIQGVSRLVDITAGGDFLGLCDQNSAYGVGKRVLNSIQFYWGYSELYLRVVLEDASRYTGCFTTCGHYCRE